MTEIDNKQISLSTEWPYRLLGNIIILSFIFSLAIITVTIREEFVAKKLFDLTQYFYEQSNKIGFTIDDIVVEGRDKTTAKEISSALKLDREQNILSIDVADIKEELEKLPWIETATVKRGFFPNILHITLKEKKVGSLWQIDGKFYPLDESGEIIETDFIPQKPLLLIVGKNAANHLRNLLPIIKQDTDIFERIKVANFISERRWNVVLDDVENGLTIKLPEENVKEAWEKLLKINQTHGIFKRKLTIIDLRLPDKVIVKIGKMNSDDQEKLTQNKEKKV